MIGRSRAITGEQAAFLLRLAGEAGEQTGLDARRRHVLRGMRRLIGGHSGLLFQMRRYRPDTGFATPGSVLFEGLDDAAAARQRAYLVEGQAIDVNAPVMIGRPERVLTVARRRLLDDATWYASDHYQRIRRPCGIDDQLYSKTHLPDGTMIGLGLQREPGDRPFTDRDGRLIDLFNTQLASVYLPRPGDAESSDPLASLAPRFVPVLNRLLAGDSAKQVANRLGLSVHTVNEYVKVIYRTVGVSSRGELLARFLRPTRA